VRLLIVCALASVLTIMGAAQSHAQSKPGLRLTFYRVAEQHACGPGGYARRSCRKITEKVYGQLKDDNLLTPIGESIVIPPNQVRLRPDVVALIRRYTQAVETLDETRRFSALVVVEEVVGGSPLHRAMRRPRITFDHQALQHLDPESRTPWPISLGRSAFRIIFTAPDGT
jgi:hypothetical protein